MENQNEQYSNQIQQSLPNATGVLVLGILSIVCCCCIYGIVGAILGIISIVLASKANKLYLSSPESYTESSTKNMKAGKVCAIIGVSLSSLFLIYLVVMLAFFGSLLTSIPWEEIINQAN